MAQRAIWKGIVTFGMVSIPVKLYSATTSKSIGLHLVHKKCDTRIKEQRFCPHCDEVVEWSDVARGYEYSKNEFVEITDKDFEKLPLPTKHTVEVTDFVSLEEIDPVFFDKAYHVDPDPAAKKPFALFMKAMTDKNVIALGKVALRSKERLCALRAVEGTLVLNTLLYPDEITIDLDKPLPKVSVSEKELDMAERLIDMMTEEFDPEKYTDDYREALIKLIEAKVEGKEIKAAPEADKGKVVDLLDALQASMEKYGKKGESKSEKKPKAVSRSKSKAKSEAKPRKSTSAARKSASPKTGTTRKKRATTTGRKKAS